MSQYIEAGIAIELSRTNLAKAIVDREYELQPELRCGKSGYEQCIHDTLQHLSCLTEALNSTSPALFYDYIAWAKILRVCLGIGCEDFETNLRCIQEILLKQLPPGQNQCACDYIEQVLRDFPLMPVKQTSFINSGNPLADLARKYLDALLSGDHQSARQYIMDSVDQGIKIKDIYRYVFQCVQREIGQLWQTNKISVAQEHYCSATTQQIMAQLYPEIISGNQNGRKIVTACVSGELHEIGARMVSDFFEMEGWDAYYIGANTPVKGILAALTTHDSDVLALSATMTWHVSKVREIISLVRSSKLGQGIKIIVGGYPFNIEPNLWKQVGADAFAIDAQDAVNAVKNLEKSSKVNNISTIVLPERTCGKVIRREFFGKLDLHGKIMEVLLPDSPVTFLQTGQNFSTAFAQSGREEALCFWVEVLQKGKATHWHLPLPFGEQGPYLFYDAIRHGDEVFLAISSSKSNLPVLYTTLLSVSETNIGWPPILKMLKFSVEALFPDQYHEEMMRLNNNLVNVQRELSKKNTDLLRIGLAKSSFFANISHEIRTPLTAILSYAEELLNQETPLSRLELMDSVGEIKGSGQQLLQLINNLLDLSKAEASKMILNLTELKMDRIVRSVELNLRSLARRQKITVNLIIEDVPYIIADEKRVRQVITNLLENAIKYSASGSSVHVKIHESLQPETGVILVIEDTGPGIPASALPHIFDEYYRYESPGKSVTGTGLGLCLVKQIVNLHLGHITVDSVEGQGTTFSIFWPTYPSVDPDLE